MRTVRLRRPHHSNPFVVYLVTMCCLTFTLVFIFTQCAQFIWNGMSQDKWLPVFSEGTSSQRSGDDTTRNIILGLNTTVIKYSAFSTNKPLFLDQHDEKLFWSNPDNQIQSRLPSPEQLVGQIKVLKDHVIHSEQNCGWQTNQTFLHHVSPRVRIRKHVDYVCPLLVPQSNSFQHFIDGVLPKIMQVFHVINTTNVKILLYRSWDRNIEQILAELGFSPDRIVYYDSGYIIGKYVLDTCVTPPLHPSLWNMARIHLGVKAFHPVRNSNGFVVYISRTGSRNYGRNIKNEEEIINYLQRRYSNRFKFFQRPGSLKETMNLFKNTRILLGAHGGALYNILFCPQDTEIIEIMPTEENGNVVPNSLAHTIIWKMSSMLRQNYWRLPSQPQNKLGDIKPDLQKLEKVLNIIDNAHGL